MTLGAYGRSCYTGSMATLTETAYYSRNMIKYGVIGVLVFLMVRSGVLFGVAYWRKLHPPPPPPPTVLFGQLPPIIFPDTKQPVLTYKLETISGTTPNLGDRATVYFMPVRTASLLALDRMNELARKLDFLQQPQELSATRYRWTRDAPLPATLTADIISESFTIEVSWHADPGLLDKKRLPNDAAAIEEAHDFLQNLGLLPDDLRNGAAKISYLRADINVLVKAPSLSEADFVRVDLFRANVNDLPVYPPNPDRGVVSLLFSGDEGGGKRIITLNYNYFPITYEQLATYPIKTADEAWAQLQAGQGFVARLDAGVSTVVVRQITLGYYDSAIPQHYLQPTYVFEGDSNFVAYVPALPSGWILAEE